MSTAFQTRRLEHFTRISDLHPETLAELLELAEMLKDEPARYEDALRGRAIACIFEKPSTRTRVSFAAAAARLGATPIALTPQELQLGRGESIADTARSLSGYVDAIVIRTFAQETVEELARWSTRSGSERALERAPSLPGTRRSVDDQGDVRRPGRQARRIRRRRR